MKKRYLAFPYIIWIIIFTILPLLLILYFGVTINDGGKLVFSFKYFDKFFNPIYLNVLWKSIKLALISTLLCLILGYPVALILSKSKSKTNIVLFLFVLPMWMNFLLRTYAWLTLLEKNGLINTILKFLRLPTINILYTDNAILLGMVYNFLPFMILPIYTVLKKLDHSFIEAAQDLGANKINVFLKIIFPLSMPGVISGISMVFMPAVTTFVIPKLLGGSKINLIGNIIEEQFSRANNWHFGSTLSIILMIIILISMGIMNKFDKKKEGVGLW